MKIIALLTDFGLKDPYVAEMKAKMLTINPNLNFVDITHEVNFADIRQAGFKLFKSYRYFPDGTIFLVVVDPGVGTSRKPIIVSTKKYYFVGPDNGVFSYIYENEEHTVYEIKVNDKNVSYTFHGRDIFAPTSARPVSYTHLTLPTKA